MDLHPLFISHPSITSLFKSTSNRLESTTIQTMQSTLELPEMHVWQPVGQGYI